MKTIGLYVNTDKDPGCSYSKMITGILTGYGFKVIVSSKIASEFGTRIQGVVEGDILTGSDMIISLGGDGTFLRVARSVYSKNIPVLGVNLGSLGFLTDIDRENAPEALYSISKGDFSIEKRMMLSVQIMREGKLIAENVALNDAVISSGALSRTLYVKTYINDLFVDMFPGDGLIISSPTGSTAYSLSAGGPIVEPDTQLMIITPICPHILYTRSFIIEGSRVVKVVIDESNQHDAMVTIDGQIGYEVRRGDVVTVSRSQYEFNLVKCKAPDFFSILRNKIYFRGGGADKDEV